MCRVRFISWAILKPTLCRILSFLQQPLIEEYSIAAQVFKLTGTDVSEVARNSVLMCGFEDEVQSNTLICPKTGYVYLLVKTEKNSFHSFLLQRGTVFALTSCGNIVFLNLSSTNVTGLERITTKTAWLEMTCPKAMFRTQELHIVMKPWFKSSHIYVILWRMPLMMMTVMTKWLVYETCAYRK